MDTVIVESKVRIPELPRGMVPRERLQSLLEENVPRYPLILISAPAGYGKTTLLAAWARSDGLPAAWLTAEAGDEDAIGFLRYLLAAWERVQPEIGESPLATLLRSLQPDLQAALAAFSNATHRAPGPLAFVIDDYHLIDAPEIHDALAYLLDHLPPHFHFILTSRSEPPLPVARYRARSRLLEINAADLHFDRAEADVFLNQAMALDLSTQEVAALQARTEGWAAGLQLAGLGLRRRPEGDNGLPAVSGRQRYIGDYLRTDVLARLPEAMQGFLLQTGILERLCGPLCETVTGEPGGGAMLERLERENLFTVPLDDRREWFRYHSLFAEFLQAELQRRRSGEVSELHRRAAHWFSGQDLAEPAFRHALASGEPTEVIRTAEQFLPRKILGGDLAGVARWLEAVPADWYGDYPALRFVRAAFLMQTGALDACTRLLDEIEQEIAPPENPDDRRLIARMKSLRCGIACFRGDMAMAESFSAQALPELDDRDLFFRAMIHFGLGDTYRNNGLWEQSEANYHKVLQYADAPFFRFLAVHIYGALADLELRQGHLQAGTESWRKALQAVQNQETWGSIPLPVSGWVYVRLGEVLYERNRLAAAEAHVQRGLERAELGGDVQARIAGYLAAGRIRLAQGEEEAAAGFLEQARPLVEQAQFPDWAQEFERLQVELWLAQDQLRAAVDWAAAVQKDGELINRPAVALAAARVWVAADEPGALERAGGLLKDLGAAAEAQGRTGVRIEALALQAIVDWRLGRRAGALAVLEQALRLAEPEGYVRLFVNLGLPLARVLQEAHSRKVMAEYVDELLESFEGGAPGTKEAPLPEPLTDREREVLELIAAGLTNREIAAELVIAPGTVKKHTGNIYGKLGVSNRTQAAARARELGWLK